MTKLSYSEQLRHPKWQKKRLEILEGADFACQACFDTEKTLNVHHKRYIKGRMAWEYEAIDLVALCESCHQVAHEDEDNFKAIMASLNPDGPCNVNDAMGLVAGWTRGHGDVPEATILATSSPLTSLAGIVARQLCEEIGWRTGGGKRLMTLATLLESPKFLEFFVEILDDAAAQFEKAEGNA